MLLLVQMFLNPGFSGCEWWPSETTVLQVSIAIHMLPGVVIDVTILLLLFSAYDPHLDLFSLYFINRLGFFGRWGGVVRCRCKKRCKSVQMAENLTHSMSAAYNAVYCQFGVSSVGILCQSNVHLVCGHISAISILSGHSWNSVMFVIYAYLRLYAHSNFSCTLY